jgi:hypothetical protein
MEKVHLVEFIDIFHNLACYFSFYLHAYNFFLLNIAYSFSLKIQCVSHGST